MAVHFAAVEALAARKAVDTIPCSQTLRIFLFFTPLTWAWQSLSWFVLALWECARVAKGSRL